MLDGAEAVRGSCSAAKPILLAVAVKQVHVQLDKHNYGCWHIVASADAHSGRDMPRQVKVSQVWKGQPILA